MNPNFIALALILAAGLGCSPAGPPREYFALRITNSVAQSVDLDAALIQSMKEGLAITNSLLLIFIGNGKQRTE